MATSDALKVDCGDGAVMSFPAQETAEEYSFAHHLRHWEVDKNDAYVAASCLDSYTYLVLNCTKEEAWRRIKLIRAALSLDSERT